MTMKKWGWVLLGLLVVVLFFFSREGFQDTQKIKGPPYDPSDYPRIIGLMDSDWVSSFPEDPATPAGQNAIAMKVTPILGQFHADVYQPATATLKEDDVDSFLTKNPSLYNVADKKHVKTLLMGYFVMQTPGAANAPQTQAQTVSANYAQSSGYADILRELEQGAAAVAGVSPTGPSAGQVLPGPTGPSGPPAPNASRTGSSGTGPVSNSSSSSWQTTSTSGGGGVGNQKVWGPRFNGMGMGSGFGGDNDSRGYPTLLGPTPKPSTMVEGAGVVRLPKGGGGGGANGKDGPGGAGGPGGSGGSGGQNTPSSASLGSDPNSQYLPYSRTPGDQDLIPDPYRNPSNFSTSGESSKTEPIPFLTDFSAFMK